MMRDWIYIITLILSLHLQAYWSVPRFFEVTQSLGNITGRVWANDSVTIQTKDLGIVRWLFNNSILANKNSSGWEVSNSTISLSINASIGSNTDGDVHLVLDRVKRFHTGVYVAQEDKDIYSLDLTVYEVELYSAELVLRNESGVCQAYLSINDSIDPFHPEMYRVVNSTNLIFGWSGSSNWTDFEILNGTWNMTHNPVNVDIDVQYTLPASNDTKSVFGKISLEQLINKPIVTTEGGTADCSIRIEHQFMPKIRCLRGLSYCLTAAAAPPECHASTNMNSLKLDYVWNGTAVDFYIEYDVIYGKYAFRVSIAKCTGDVRRKMNILPEFADSLDDSTSSVASTIELSTSTSLSSPVTTSESDTAQETPPPSPITENTAVPGVTNDGDNTSTLVTGSSESTTTIITSTATTGSSTTPAANSKSLADWEIILISVGSSVGIVLLVGGICFLVCYQISKRTSISNTSGAVLMQPRGTSIPMEVRSSSNNHTVGTLVSQSKKNDRRPSVSSETALSSSASSFSELREKPYRNDDRRQPQRTTSRVPEQIDPPRRKPPISRYEDQTRSVRPEPSDTAHHRSRAQETREERRRHRRHVVSPEPEPYRQSSVTREVSRSEHPSEPHQVPRGKRRPLPPLPHD